MQTRPMPLPQRQVLAAAARHPMGRVPARSTIHPATWTALYDRMFIGGPEELEHITKAGRQALAVGRTIELTNIWSMRWAHVTGHRCQDRASGATVTRTDMCWRLAPDHVYFPDGLPLGPHLYTALRRATEELTRARQRLVGQS